MNIVSKKAFEELKIAKRSLTNNNFALDQKVLEIINCVREEGDKALYRYTAIFDGVHLEQLTVTHEEFKEARNFVTEDFVKSIRKAKSNIIAFHEVQLEQSWFINQEDGITLGQQVTPIDSVGIYVPGGKAVYPSTVLMNVLPAKLAGVEKIAIVTPPQANGKVNPHVLVAAQESGVDTVYKIGGAQAIAALAYGTETVEKVAKITGPGNTYVARAKKWVFGDVAIDMIAGPSEICILADETSNAVFVAADLLSQAEHDEQACAICVTTSQSLANNLIGELNEQISHLERVDIVKKSIANNGYIIVVDTLQEAFEFINELAPEHLQLMIDRAIEHLPSIRNAGAIFIGDYSPEALGDYMAGPNHTLPTNGTAAFSSPLGVYDFVKKSSVIHYSKKAFDEVATDIITIAEAESLTAHANAIKVRGGL